MGLTAAVVACSACAAHIDQGVPPVEPSGSSQPDGTWIEDDRYECALLRPGLVVCNEYESGALHPRETRRRIRGADVDVVIRNVDDVRPWIVPITNAATALEYSSLLRKWGVSRLDVPGQPLQLKEGRDGGLGFFSTEDAARWGTPASDTVTMRNGSWVVRRIVVTVPETISGAEPFSVLVIEETITRDAGYESRVLRVLEQGPSAEVFAVLRR